MLRYRVDVHSRHPFNVDAPNLYYHDSKVEHMVSSSQNRTLLPERWTSIKIGQQRGKNEQLFLKLAEEKAKLAQNMPKQKKTYNYQNALRSLLAKAAPTGTGVWVNSWF